MSLPGLFLAFGYNSFFIQFWFWDDGNLYYPVIAMKHGQIPNVDFVHGYPGLMSWIYYEVSELFGYRLEHLRQFTWVIVMLGIGPVVWLANELWGLSLAIVTFLTIYTFGYAQLSTINQAWMVATFCMLGTYLTYLEIRRRESKGSSTGRAIMFPVAAFLIGFSLNLKQSGIFGILGFLQFMVLFAPKQWSRFVRGTLCFFFVVLPFLAFVAIRLSSQFTQIPTNSFAVLPWCLSVLFCIQTLHANRPRLQPNEFVATLMAGFASLWFWCLLTLGTSQSIFQILHEIYIKIPHVIDRSLTPIDLSWSRLALFVGLLLLPIVASFRKNLNFVRILFVFGIGLEIVWLVNLKFTIEFVYGLEMYWPAIIFGALPIGFLLTSMGQEIFSAAEQVLIVASATWIASNYPYANNAYFSAGFTILGGLLYIVGFLRLFQKRHSVRLLATILFVGAILNFGILYSEVFKKLSSAPLRNFSKLDQTLLDTQPGVIFGELAEWIKTSIPPHSTIAGYPGFAFTLALADRVSDDRFPNFIGDEKDFSDIVERIDNNKGPDYYLLAPNLFPFDSLPPMLQPTTRLVGALKDRYTIVTEIRNPDGSPAIQVLKHRNR